MKTTETIDKVAATAFIIAGMRALEQHKQNPLFEDKYATLFLTQQSRTRIKQLTDMLPETIESIRCRTKYFNDQLQTAIEQQGVKQILILGAGFDMRACIFAAPGVDYFEVDQASIIDYKTTRLYQENIPLRSKMIKCNYFTRDVIQVLQQNHFDFARKTFILWEGNTMYLPRPFVQDFLITLKHALQAFIISFDYFSRELIDNNTGIKATEQLTAFFANQASPFVNGYNDLQQELTHPVGLGLQNQHSAAELAANYLGRRAETTLLDYYHVATAYSGETLAH